jgi:hypothetical protein
MRGWPTFTFVVKGWNDEVGGHGWKIGTQAALVHALAKPAKVDQPRSHSEAEGQNPHPNVAKPE